MNASVGTSIDFVAAKLGRRARRGKGGTAPKPRRPADMDRAMGRVVRKFDITWLSDGHSPPPESPAIAAASPNKNRQECEIAHISSPDGG
jgi:hypothetical protein